MYHEIKDGLVYLYDSYAYKEQIKQIFGRRWLKDKKAWAIPYRPEIIKEANEILNCSIEMPKVKTKSHNVDPKRTTFIPYLYAHQRVSVRVGSENTYMADLSEPGTGKTLVSIELLLQRGAFPALIICPKSITDAVWAEQIDEINQILSPANQMSYQVLVGGRDKISATLTEWIPNMPERMVFIINYDIVAAVEEGLKIVGFNHLILDESTRIKTPSTKRSKAILRIAGGIPHRHIMTGTLAPNGLLDAFNQMKFLSSDIFGQSYYAFRHRYFLQNPFQEYQWDLKPGAMDEFNRVILPFSIQHKKRECVDLPPMTEERRLFDLSGEAEDAYQQMKEEALLVLADQQVITAPFKITELMKLRQICSGFIYHEQETYEFNNNKYFELAQLLEIFGDQKVIIFAHFNKSIQRLRGILEANAVAFMGSSDEKQLALSQFKNNDRIRYLVANPASAAHGLNLQFCSNIIYYELDYNLENYLQSIDRINRIGQENKMSVYYLIARQTIETFIHKKLKAKQDMNSRIDVNELRKAL